MEQVAGRPAVPSLLGRDRPLATLAAALADARGGTRGVALVEGEAGIGKTSLLREALRDAQAMVVWASGDEAELHVDHGIIDQLVRAAPLDAEARRDALPTAGDDPLRTGAAIVRLVDGLDIDPDHPLVVVVDDAQWADLPSLRALTFAARRLRRDAVLLCVAVRSEGISHLPEGLLRLADDGGTRVWLGPLDRADVRLLAEAQVGQPVSAAAADRLLAHTRGSPLHLRTLLDELPPGAITSSADLPSPRSFAALVLSRLGGCSPDVEALVTAVAVLGEPAEVAIAAQLAGVAEPLATLDDAVAHGLLVPVDPVDATDAGVRAATPHPLIRAAVLGDLPVGRRAALHRRAAGIVGGTAGLRHRILGARGPDVELWRDAVDAAATEAARGAHGTAGALLRQAARVAATDDDRDQALLDAVDHFLLAGQLDDAVALRSAVDAAAPSPWRSYVQGRLAYVTGPRRAARVGLTAAWDALVAIAGGEGGLQHLPQAERDLAGRVAAMRAVACVDRALGEEAIGWCQWALALAPDQAALASTAHMLAGAHALAGRMPGGLTLLDDLCAALARSGEAAAEPAVADAHSGRGLLRLWTHDLEGAADDLEISLAAAARAGSFAARESARFYLAETRYRQGRWDDAVLLAQVAASIVDDGEQAWMAALPHATAARPLAARGEQATQEHLDRATSASAAVGSGIGISLTQVSALEVAACRRDHDRVIELGDLLSAHRQPVDERIAPWRASYAEALVARDRTDDASAVAADLELTASTPLMANDASRAVIAVAGTRADAAALDAAAEVGLALDPISVGPYPRARLELLAGRAWRHRGERRRALAVLEAARARFEYVGARPWIDQVEREIAASGLRPARRSQSTGANLTPQEQAVAQLVARGLTNREVGAELIVSAKTVEHHLSRIYSKLGIRSRTELARTVLTPGE